LVRYTGAMIDLRELEDGDYDRLYQWRCEPEVDRWMSAPRPPSPEAHRRWFEAVRSDPDRCGWVITSSAQPVGFLLLTGLVGPHKRAEWGWYIGEAAMRGRGAGRAAQALGLDRAFDGQAVEKVWSEVMADNEVALKAQAAAGFRREGYLRRHVIKDGSPHDVVVLGILREEWTERREAARRELARSGLIAG
jgi:UDP-4-amino-4,6-dideoxy-N-acetyl-beta-L-altrosamine N-acetyltransferase